MWQSALINILSAVAKAISSNARVVVHVEIETGGEKATHLFELPVKNGKVLATSDGEIVGEHTQAPA